MPPDATTATEVAFGFPTTPKGTTRRPQRPASSWGVLGGLSLLVAFGYMIYHATLEPAVYIQGTIYAMLATAIAYPVIRSLGRSEPNFDLGGIALVGFGMRLMGATLRFQDPSDSGIYWQVGVELAKSFRRLQFNIDTGREIPGTGFLRYLAGLAQVVTLDDFFSSFMIWVLFSFFGIVLAYKAFALGVIGGDRKRYAIVLFCWPTLCFWPSSVGKEGWMMLCLGVGTYGAALFFSGRTFRGLSYLGLGILAATMIRPHMGLMIAVAFAAAIVAGTTAASLADRPQGALDRAGPTMRASQRAKLVGQARAGARAVAIIVLLIGGAVLVQRAAEFFKVDALGTESVSNTLDDTSNRTSEGGSAFTPAVVRTPIDYPRAFFTVMFRPMPYEAKGFNDRLAAVEGMILLGLMVLSWPRLRLLPTKIGRQPMVVFSTTFVVVFAYAFSAIGNFGILARQRSQVLPLLLVLIALPLIRNPAPTRADKQQQRRSTTSA